MPAASNSTDTPPRRRPATILLFGLFWLTALAGVVLLGARLTNPATLDASASAMLFAVLTLQIAPPLAIIIVGIELIRRSGRDSGARVAELETRTAAASAAMHAVRDGLLDVDATLTAIAGRVDGLRANAADNGTGLIDTARRLESVAAELAAAGSSADTTARQLLGRMGEAQGHADALGSALAATGDEVARQLDTVETMLAGVWARNVDARDQVTTATAAMAGLLAGIEAAATAAAAAIADRTAGLGASVDAALDRTTAAIDATRDGVHVQTSALLATVDQARLVLDQIGGEASRTIATRLERVATASNALAASLGDHDERSRTLVATVERSFTILDVRLGHAAAHGTAMLEGLAARMTAVRDQVDAIVTPLGAANTALGDAEAGAARLSVALDSTLPAHRDALTGLAGQLETAAAAAAGLAAPVAATGTAAGALTGELAAAQASLAAIEGVAQGSALAASSQLIEVLSRVREVANATAGTMRTTLAEVVAEAETALENAGSTRAAAAFGDPIRAEIAGLEGASALAGAAAQATAERIAERLLGLTKTVATVEARIDEAATRFDARLRDDIARRSSLLVESLRANAIDLARALATDVSDTDWAAHLKGDRSIFGRRAVKLLDGATARAIARQFKDDPAFAEQAARYISDFDTLLDTVRADREGQALAVTLVSSDVGKLYVALTQALDPVR